LHPLACDQMATATDDLREYAGQISDLGRARALLAWDEHTKMPKRGASMRAEQLATLTGIRHRLLSSDDLGRLLDVADASLDGADPDSFEASLARVTRREWDKARRVPVELRSEIARVTSVAEHAWERAREESDFAAFLPHLERVLELKRRYVECFEYDHPYDPLLDDFEPGMTTAELRPVLEQVREGVVPLLAEIQASGVELDDSPLYGEFDPAAQAELAQRVAEMLPLEPDAWRLDTTVHPFAAGIAVSDLRITTRFDPSYVGSSLFAVIHECGHAIYNNGIDHELERTLLCQSSSLGFDESQSRLWENWVGRGRPFAGRLLPLLAESFPGRFDGLDAEGLYRAANAVRPSLIRVEADEVTYNLHIALRFELEVALVEETVKPADLPDKWAELTDSYLSLEVPDDASGVLQDVHWSAGLLGYFPTYSLGNVIAAQIWEKAREALPNLDQQLAAGELQPLRDFLGERVLRHGGKHEPAEMIVRAVGSPLDPGPLLEQLRAKFGALYEL
jgi:carboxypeptidase Taq